MTFPPAGRARLRPSSGFHPYDPAHQPASRPPNGAETVRSGRDAELRVIDELLDSVDAGKSPVAVIWGEPGIGKTSLIREAIERGSSRGFSTLSGRAAEYEQDLPLAVFSEAISRALGAADLERLDLDEGNRAALASVLPFLGLSAAQPPRMDTRAPERHYVLRALHALLESLAAENPLVLALDDLHWSDSASIDLVSRIVHHGIVHPSLLVLALRPGQAETRPAQRAVGGRAPRAGGLAGAAAAHQRRVRRAAEGRRQPRAAPADLQRERWQPALPRAARGHPEDARPGRRDAGAGRPGARSARSIRAEAEALSDDRPHAAARAPPSPATRSTRRSPPRPPTVAPADALCRARRARRQRPDPPRRTLRRRFRFRHPIVRHAVYQSTGAGWRLGSHGRVAAALAARGNPAPRARRTSSARPSRATRRRSALLTAGRPRDAAATRRSAPRAGSRPPSRLVPADREHLEQRLSLAGQRATALGIAGRLDDGAGGTRSSSSLWRRRSRRRCACRPPGLRGDLQRAARLATTRAAGSLLDEIARLPEPGRRRGRRGPQARARLHLLLRRRLGRHGRRPRGPRSPAPCGGHRPRRRAGRARARRVRPATTSPRSTTRSPPPARSSTRWPTRRSPRHHPGHRGLARLGRGLQRALRGRDPTPASAAARIARQVGPAPPRRGGLLFVHEPGARADRTARASSTRDAETRHRGLAAVDSSNADAELGDDDRAATRAC